MDIQVQCYFVDVGQGTCQIICLGGRRAIVIDTGPPCPREKSQKSIISILKALNIETIESLILSHNDKDHIGQATTILTTYKSEVRSIWLLQDRPVGETQLFDRLTTCLKQSRTLGCKVGCLAHDSEPKILFEDKKKELTLKVVYPPFLQTFTAQSRDKPNDACAVLRLDVGKSKILFTGDATFDSFKYLYDKFGVIASDVMSVPHHGNDLNLSDCDLTWIYCTVLQASFAVISTGTTNRYGHPSEKVVNLIRQSGAEILCTQMTPKCSSCLSKYRQKRGDFNLNLSYSHSQSKPVKKKTKNANTANIACCGTIAVDIGIDAVEVQHLQWFQNWKSQQSSRLCS